MMSRSGTSLMWIKATAANTSYHFQRIEHILNIADTNWERIQKLEVFINFYTADQWQPLLHRPAPHLESLRIDFDGKYSKFNNIVSSLFSGSAPMLHQFCLKGRSLGDTAQRWVQHLRYMELSAELSVARTLRVLALATNLTNL